MQPRPFLITAFLSIALSFSAFSQIVLHNPTLDSTQLRKPWSYNILFPAGATQAEKDRAIAKLKAWLLNNFHTIQTRYDGLYKDTLIFHVTFCPCDPRLYTMGVDLILAGTGEVATKPPTNPVKPGGSGDLVNTITYNYKLLVTEAAIKEYGGNRSKATVFPDHPVVDHSNILAILDTGLDPTLFPPGVKSLIWTAERGTTQFDFLPGHFKSSYRDDNPERHGSAVTGMALGEIKNGKTWPALMIMKVLDKDKTGSSFSVSCALSYAWQHHARVINLSLGYYDNEPVDSVLEHYIKRCVTASPKPITVFAAAGNTDDSHDQKNLCGKHTNLGFLWKERLFYPACLSVKYDHLISVTGLASDLSSSCVYQNYSPEYVTVGLLKKDASLCCIYKFPYNERYYEGTSFATPIVSGMVMNTLLTGSAGTSALGVLGSLSRPATSLKNTTVKGTMIAY